MRIQHNIMAMNAYRNYSNNTSALAKNLEKLSSGYRINRAGDDAAGLAISEKMRAQITALGTAQKNVKDGISLVKTAEGATQEIHDMLNRMVDLATQSANGTYQDQVDREAIQREYDALKTEIDRIADASNFNGIKLLDGKLGLNEDAFTLGSVEGTAAKAVDGIITSEMPAAKATGAVAGTDTILHKDGNDAQSGTFTIDVSQLKVESADGKKGDLTFTIGNATFDVTATNNGDTMNGADIATKLAAAINGSAGGGIEVKADGTANTSTANGATGSLLYTATANADGTVTLTATKWSDGTGWAALGTDNLPVDGVDDGALVSPGFDVSFAEKTAGSTKSISGNANIDGTKTQTPLKAGATEFGNTFLEIDVTKLKDGMTMTIAGQTKTIGTDIKLSDLDLTDTTDQGLAMDRIVNAFADNQHVSVGQDAGTFGKLTLSEKVDPATGKSKASEEMQKKMSTLDGFKSLVSFGEGAKSAGTTIKLADATKLTKGDVLTINDGKTEKTYSYDKDFTDMDSLKTAMEADGFKVELNDAGDTLTVRASAADGLAPSVLGKGLTLQIGEDSQSYNQLSVAIADMHCSSLGLETVDLDTQTNAQAAVDVIKNAINMVSTTRGKLGATQNRLEHTANNLSTMKENIQDAEATIRDTDIAEEMMAYTKNNILVQSAQAMLAQANQIPQGVLQLLG